MIDPKTLTTDDLGRRVVFRREHSITELGYLRAYSRVSLQVVFDGNDYATNVRPEDATFIVSGTKTT